MLRPLIPVALLCSGCEIIEKNPYLSALIPKVGFDSLQVNYVDFERIETDFVFAIDNPNPVGIDIEHFSYDLGFSETQWLAGENEDGLLLNPVGESTVALPTEIVFTELYDMIQAIRGADDLPFTLEGDFGLRLDSDTLVLPGTSQSSNEATAPEQNPGEDDSNVLVLPYDAAGAFPALQKPSISFDALNVRELSFSGAVLDLVLDVDNAHASNLTFQRFEYDLKIAGSSLIEGIADNLDAMVHGLADGTDAPNRQLIIPIELRSTALIGSLWDVLTSGGRPSVSLDALTDVDTPFGLVELAVNENGQVEVNTQ